MDFLSSAFVLAATDEKVGISFFEWAFQSLGFFYGVLIPLTGLLVFLGACLVVMLSRRPAVIAAYLVFLPLPMLIGVYGSVEGLIACFSMSAMPRGTPLPAEVGIGISTALFSTVAGMAVSFPSYFVLAFGLFFRTLFSPKTSD